ncbi:MAG: hypothetical protein HON90_12815 [Halobacteriovoraceae bacterium]|jgi:hypothetical protein|nr:hypothetical protein [Halobacteriovoraceae bacterium]
MKILILLSFIVFKAAFANDFTPFYESFAYKVKSAQDIKLTRHSNSSNFQWEKDKKRVLLFVDGGVASCSTFSDLSYLFGSNKYKTEVVSCDDRELVVNIKYWRTQACDQELVISNKKIKVKLPSGCLFSAESGKVTLSRY